MKTILLLLVAVVILSACSREQDQLSADQLNSVRKMEKAYQLAKSYNDSLVAAHNANVSSQAIRYYDEMYHQNEAAFESCHQAYPHTSSSANHSHDSQGKVQMHTAPSGLVGGSGMMGGGDCQCCTNGGHSNDIHEQMDALRRTHALHHP